MVAAALSGAPKDESNQTLNKLDREGEAYMKHAEKKYRRLKSGRIPFSPEEPRYGFASAKFFVLFCGGIMESYGTTATYAALHDAVKSMPCSNSPSTISNYACGSVRRSVIIFGSTGNATGSSI